MFTERLKHFLLSGNFKLRGVYMKALCERIKAMMLDKALGIAGKAAGQAFEEIGDILQLASVWRRVIFNKFITVLHSNTTASEEQEILKD